MWPNMEKEGRRERIDAQIAQIEQKLNRGTEQIKEGHKIPGVNPEGKAVEVPLTAAKEEKLLWNLAVLKFRRDNPRPAGLPYELSTTNPN